MREEYNSVLSTPTEADKIGRFGRYRYIGKIQISVDISVDLYIECPYFDLSKLNLVKANVLKAFES